MAHEYNDFALLSKLYTIVADQCDASNDIDAACFYWTQALVFALDAGLEEVVAELSQKLSTHGRL